MNGADLPEITRTIIRGLGTVHVRGVRSRPGWDVFEERGGDLERIATAAAKDEAQKAALDCCEPGVRGLFHVVPAVQAGKMQP